MRAAFFSSNVTPILDLPIAYTRSPPHIGSAFLAKKEARKGKKKKKQTKPPLLDRELLDRSSPEASTPHSNSIHLLRFDRSKQASKPRCFKLYSTPLLSPHTGNIHPTHTYTANSNSQTQKTKQSRQALLLSSLLLLLLLHQAFQSHGKKMKKNGPKKKPARTILSSFSCTIPAPIHNWIPSRTSVSRSLSLSLSLSFSRRQLRSSSIPARTQLHKAWCAV